MVVCNSLETCGSGGGKGDGVEGGRNVYLNCPRRRRSVWARAGFSKACWWAGGGVRQTGQWGRGFGMQRRRRRRRRWEVMWAANGGRVVSAVSLGSQMLRGAGDGGTSPFPRRSDPYWMDGRMDGRTDEARRRLGFVASSWLPTGGGNASSLHCTEIGRGRKRERKRPSHGPYGPTTAGLLGSCFGWARWRHIGRSEWSQHAQVACSAQPSPAQPSPAPGLAWLMARGSCLTRAHAT